MKSLYEKILAISEQKKDKGTKYIAKYFLETDVEKLANQSMDTIAKNVFTTKASISRFAKALGINDFKYFKNCFLDERKAKETAEKKLMLINVKGTAQYDLILENIIKYMK